MDIEEVRAYCLSLPFVTEEIKWQHVLTFMVKDKIFALLSLDENPIPISFKTRSEDFEELRELEGFRPAPYLGKGQWIQMSHVERISDNQLKNYLYQSYFLIKTKMPKKKFDV
jgi:predicted DNA-binding protein (MmcQ/YjbR family)